ncbi:MAG: hypothetical protein ABL909_02745 [Sphingopyxis sp.]
MNRVKYRMIGAAIIMAAASWAGSASAACNDGRDRNVTVVNGTSTTVRELYGSNVSRGTWEEDVLGANVLPSRQQIRINWDDNSCQCLFDFKAVLVDGTEIIRRRFNVCTETTWTIS